MRLRDEVGPIYTDEQFAALYPIVFAREKWLTFSLQETTTGNRLHLAVSEDILEEKKEVHDHLPQHACDHLTQWRVDHVSER